MGRRSSRGGNAYGRRGRIATGVVLAVLILVSWLSFDWLLATPRTAQVIAQLLGNDGKPDDRTPGHPVEVGSSSVSGMASGPARGADRGGPSSSGRGSYSSSAGPAASTGLDSIASTGGESSGSTSGWSPVGSSGSGAGSNGSPATVTAGLSPNAGVPPRGSGPGGAPGSEPVSDGSTLSGASDGDGPWLPGGPVGPTASTGGSAPHDNNGQSGPPGGTTGPVPDATPPGSEVGPGPDATVPVPPALLVFGAAGSMLAVMSRMRRRARRERGQPPLTR